jgi:HPt (histidine-containing phosphotransfer) domain-containing protein
MNDYIIKPFEERNLLLTIIKNLPVADGNSGIIGAFSQPSSEKLYNLGLLLDMSHGNKDFIKKMINIFCEQVPELSFQLINFWQSGDYVAMKKIAHKIKPSLANFGVISVSEDIKAIESFNGSDLKKENLELNINHLIDITGKVIDQLRSDTSI